MRRTIGEHFDVRRRAFGDLAVRGVTERSRNTMTNTRWTRSQPGTLRARIIETRSPVQNADVTAGELSRAGHPYARALVELGGFALSSP